MTRPYKKTTSFLFFSLLVVAAGPNLSREVAAATPPTCTSLFRSRLYYENKALQDIHKSPNLHPRFVDIKQERELQKQWNKTLSQNVPDLLKILFPEDVYFIDHQLRQPERQTAVKLGEPGGALMVRAFYNYKKHTFGTNVTFSSRALLDNLKNISSKKKWLVGTDARAAILFLHGGGTKSAGSHVATSIINNFRSYQVDVVAVDLPWHGEGPRDVFSNFQMEIKALGAFAQKYIPPHVPVFVWGHSWGSVYAEKLMTMTDLPPHEFVFHNNLKGVMIFSTPVDTAPGKSFKEKQSSMFKRITRAKNQLSHLFAEHESQIWQEIVEEGKTSPLGGFFAAMTTFQIDQSVPDHKGKKYIPALMAVGTADPLVYVGFEDIYRSYYDQLVNVQSHYLDKLALYSDPNGEKLKVGHLLGDYVNTSAKGKAFVVYYQLSKEFIENQLDQKLPVVKEQNNNTLNLVLVIQNFANDMAFRQFFMEHEHFLENNTSIYTHFIQKREALGRQIISALAPYGQISIRTHNFFKKLSEITTLEDFEKLKPEIHTLLHYYAKNIPYSKYLNQKLEELYEKKGTVKDIRMQASEILNKFFKTIPLTTKKLNAIIKPILQKEGQSNKSLDGAVQALKTHHLPVEDETTIIKYLTEYFYIENTILRGTFVPPLDLLLHTEDLVSPANHEKVKKHIHQMNLYAKRKEEINKTLDRLTVDLTQAQKKYQSLLNQVQHYIKKIKTAFTVVTANPPVSLKSAYEQNRKDFKELEKTSDTMGNLLEEEVVDFMTQTTTKKPSVEKETAVVQDFAQILNRLEKHRELIDHFSTQYTTYIRDRQQLRRKLIAAIEEGNMGPEFQEAVVKIYGQGSDGERPQLGSQSLFLDLENKLNDLAKLETQIYFTLREKADLTVGLQDLFEHLLNLVNLEVDTNNWWHKQAHLVVSARKVSAPDVFSDLKISYQENESEEQYEERTAEINNYITAHAFFFQEIISTWNQDLRSSLPPVLPNTAKD